MATSPASRAYRYRLIALAAIVGIVIVAVALVLLGMADDSPGAGWVRVGPVQAVRARGVVPLRDIHAFVVIDPPRRPIGLLARSPHLGEPVVYCASSGWFEEPAHGAMFDRLGRYELGPAPRGLDRLATIVRDGVVWVNPTEITLGPPRGARDITPTDSFCSADN